MAQPEFVVGDTVKALEIEVVNKDGVAQNLAGSEVRAFAEGVDSGDLPASAAIITVASCTTTSGSKIMTMSSSAGILANMIVIAVDIPDGTEIASVDSGVQVTLSKKALTTHAGDLTVKFWNGILCVITNEPAALAEAQGLGGMLDIGSLKSEIYNYRARWKTAAPVKFGWSKEASFSAVPSTR
jgi:hypothetical protein